MFCVVDPNNPFFIGNCKNILQIMACKEMRRIRLDWLKKAKALVSSIQSLCKNKIPEENARPNGGTECPRLP